MTDNTSGFYSIGGDQTSTVSYSPTTVYFPDGTFISVDHQTDNVYPVNGWYWFDSDVSAYAFFNIAPPEIIPNRDNLLNLHPLRTQSRLQ